MNIRNEFAIINGQIYQKQDAVLSVFDGSVQYGFGIFETLRTYNGVFFGWEQHYQRMVKGCKLLSMQVPFTINEGLMQLQSIQEQYRQSGFEEDQIYRITVTPGTIEQWKTSTQHNYIITCRPLLENLRQVQKDGVHTIVLQTRRLPSPTVERVKGTQFVDILLARQELQRLKEQYQINFYEGLMVNFDNFLVEATLSNVFIVKEDGQTKTLLTPHQRQGPLMGITRQFIIQLANEMLIPVVETDIKIEQLRDAKEIFITNSAQELIPLRTVFHRDERLFDHHNKNDCNIDNNDSFPLYRSLLDRYKQLIKKASHSETNYRMM